ncbi:MAG: hypothetical protein AB8E74_07675 [Prochlorococcus sp.]
MRLPKPRDEAFAMDGPILNPNPNNFSGVRSLVATFIGALIGCTVSYFLSILISNSPTGLDPARLRLFYIMVIISGSFAGFGIEITRQMQASSTEQDYYHKRHQSYNRKDR